MNSFDTSDIFIQGWGGVSRWKLIRVEGGTKMVGWGVDGWKLSIGYYLRFEQEFMCSALSAQDIYGALTIYFSTNMPLLKFY